MTEDPEKIGVAVPSVETIRLCSDVPLVNVDRVRTISKRNRTTIGHVINACLVIALPQIEKLSAESYQDLFGRGWRAERYEKRQLLLGRQRLEKHIEIARKKEKRILRRAITH